MDTISVPIFITKEGEWFVACCPMLDIATQGRTEEEKTSLAGRGEKDDSRILKAQQEKMMNVQARI